MGCAGDVSYVLALCFSIFFGSTNIVFLRVGYMCMKYKRRWRQMATLPPQHIETAATAAVGTRDMSASRGPGKLIFCNFFLLD